MSWSCAQPEVAREVPITSPAALSACTATYDSGPGVAIAVSKPSRLAVATGVSCCALGPPRTCQLAVRVSPFQLAYTVTRPFDVKAAIAGGSLGEPVHAKR